MERQLVHEVVLLDEWLVSVWLHTEVDPADGPFEAAAREVQRAKREHAVADDQLRLFVVSDGGAPNARQRKALESHVYEGAKPPMAVLTTVLDNPIKRGIATALSWVNPSICFFEPEEREAALAHTNLVDVAGALEALLCRMARQLRPNHTLVRMLERPAAQ